MSQPPPTPHPPVAESHRAEPLLAEKELLIQAIRKDLIQAQITVLELNDTILRKETDRTDAIALMAQLETALEGRIVAAAELQQRLGAEMASLQRQLAAETAEKTARDDIISDLVRKLDAANQEIGRAHSIAAGYARDLAATQQDLRTTRDELAVTRADLAATQERLAATARELAATGQERDERNREIATLRASWSWRLTRPLRALRRLLA